MLSARETSAHDSLHFFFSSSLERRCCLPLCNGRPQGRGARPHLGGCNADRCACLLLSLPLGDNGAATGPLRSPAWSSVCLPASLRLRPALAPAPPSLASCTCAPWSPGQAAMRGGWQARWGTLSHSPCRQRGRKQNPESSFASSL